ncbi:MAG: GNAT family N-acetyltransferase [Thermoproteota archaeon]|jgi:GNAT superfamily N-acetyltransferase|nr:GNAT family N-acetyltransferase [Thermoproteota archaeon]
MVHKITLRNINNNDIPKIVSIQKESYSEVANGQIYIPQFLENHIRLFREGQFCVELDGEVVASATSLIVSLEPEYAEHTWRDVILRYGNPDLRPAAMGDSLYADDLVTHPNFRHLGIGSLLFDARKQVALKYNLRRIIGGGRIPNYCKYADRISVQKYLEKVQHGQIYDPVLTFQIRNGFKIVKVLPNYLYDPSSLNYATFIEWINPNYRKL